MDRASGGALRLSELSFLRTPHNILDSTLPMSRTLGPDVRTQYTGRYRRIEPAWLNHARRGERTRRDSARERERDRETERHRESCAMASSQRRIASLAEQMRWLHACNDPECLGRCGECAVGAVGAAGSDHHALEEGSMLTCESPRPCRV